MKAISDNEFYEKVGGFNSDWVLEVISLFKIPFFTVNTKKSSTIYSTGVQCGMVIRDLGWELDKTTAIYSIIDGKIFCVVFNIEEHLLVELFIKTKKLKAFV